MSPNPFNIRPTIQHDAVRGFHPHITIRATDVIGKCKRKTLKVNKATTIHYDKKFLLV